MVAAYNGELDEESITSFIESKSNSALQVLKSEAEKETFISANSIVVIGQGLDSLSALESACFSSLAQFAVLEGASSPRIEMHGGERDFDKTKAVVYEGDVNDAKTLLRWTTLAALAPIVRFEDEVMDMIFDIRVQYVTFLFVDDVEDSKELRDEVAALNTPVDADTAFVYAVAGDDDYLLEFFNLTAGDTPAVRLLEIGQSENLDYYPGKCFVGLPFVYVMSIYV